MIPRGTLPGPVVVAGLFIAAGLAWRAWLTMLVVPRTNSDEALIGLMATDIAEGAAAPAFLYGQHYMGAAEAWLAAPVVWLVGPSVPALRLPTTVAYLVFAVLLYRLTARLYSPWFAVLVTGLLAVGSDRVVKDQLIANGFAWIVPGCAALLWGALRLADPPGRDNRRSAGAVGPAGLRFAGFAGWGLVAGLVVWTDWLAAPYLLGAFALLVAGCRRDLLGRAGLLVGAGFLVGVAPQLLHDLTSPLADNSTLAYLRMAFGQDPPGEPPGALARLHGGLMIGVPMRMGLCGPGSCAPLAQLCGPVIVGLLIGVVSRGAWTARTPGARTARTAGRLALAVPGLLTIGLYAASSPAGATPTESVRYLCCLVISLPAVLWPLWSLARRTGRVRSAWPARAAIAILAAAAGAAGLAVGSTVDGHRQAAVDERALIAELDRRGIDRLYTDYWTCQRLMFATSRRIGCASVTALLRRGADKVPGARHQIETAARPVYVFASGGPEETAFAGYLRVLPEGPAVLAGAVEVAGYRLYAPDGRLAVPVDRPDRSDR
ncbi:glycosyltransferase family protein [Plantactinospora soyae]|uniref:Glycosyltransferase RgtA/B/C/D-like domain-containing protein n=1 Tax=Plantactinospora soyae TaxID=1544732 RepID=A0A927MCM4_9ACTN|nr:hypothetical protein [Plantactinospora soyae]MBE1492009.1 hypothetical protein [Plantactinospora soyae]